MSELRVATTELSTALPSLPVEKLTRRTEFLATNVGALTLRAHKEGGFAIYPFILDRDWTKTDQETVRLFHADYPLPDRVAITYPDISPTLRVWQYIAVPYQSEGAGPMKVVTRKHMLDLYGSWETSTQKMIRALATDSDFDSKTPLDVWITDLFPSHSDGHIMRTSDVRFYSEGKWPLPLTERRDEESMLQLPDGNSDGIEESLVAALRSACIAVRQPELWQKDAL